MRSNWFWIAALGALVLISVAAMLLLERAPAGRANVYQDGVLVESINMSAVAEPYSFTVTGAAGYNVITVESGLICVSDASCPDKLCVRQGWVGSNAIPIVCLPHRLVIRLELESSAYPEVDAVVG